MNKTITLPRLGKWVGATLETTALKLMEEGGELAQAIGRMRGLAAEIDSTMNKIVAELLDVAQTAVTMMYVLEEQYGVNIDSAMKQHVDKLRRKGYLE